jgi:ferritin-like metal-binding protein YciE
MQEGKAMAQEKTLRDALVDEIRDLYDAERQLTKALPNLMKAASNDDLQLAFESHLEQTQQHLQRLEDVFDMLDEKVSGKHCAGIAGIIEEGKQILDEFDGGPLLDACLIAAAQRAEHYEITAYGTAIAWAQILGEDDAASLLELTIEEEKAADQKLSNIAEEGVNAGAAGGDEQSAEAEDDEHAPAGVPSSRKTRQPSRRH